MTQNKTLRRIGKSVLNIVVGVAAGLVLLLVAAVIFADRLIFQPPPAETPPAMESYLALPDGGRAAFCYLPPRTEGGWVILFSHGNAEDLSRILPLLYELNRAGFGVMSYDYPGYGRSDGAPSEKGAYRNALAAYDYLRNDRKIAPERIAIMGFSVGGGSACFLAESREAGALILLAPFTSAFQVVLPWATLPFDRFPNRERITRIVTPLWIVHGDADAIIAPKHGQKLFAMAKSPVKQFDMLSGVGHNDLCGGLSMKKLREFLERAALK